MTYLRGIYITLLSAFIALTVSASALDDVAASDDVVTAKEVAMSEDVVTSGDANTICQFVHIDASQHPILSVDEKCASTTDSDASSDYSGVCTRFVTEIYTGWHAPNGYNIEIRYPEFVDLTAKEKKLLKKISADAISSDSIQVFPISTPVHGLELQQYVAVSQKRDFVNVSFSPIVYHNNKWKRIVSCQLRITPSAPRGHHAPETDSVKRWSDKSVLATGKWVKVRVSDEGVYQLNGETIKKFGFNDLSKVKVYGYGGLLQEEILNFPAYDESVQQNQVPDDLVEVPVHETSDGRLLFWMEGTRRKTWDAAGKRYTHTNNHYSRYSYYFITQNDAPRLKPARISSERNANSEASPSGKDLSLKTISAVPYVSVVDPDSYNWYSGGRRLFDSFDFQTNSSHSYRVLAPDLVQSDTYIPSASICIGAASHISSTSINISINGNKLATQTIDLLKTDTDFAKSTTKHYPIQQEQGLTDTNIFQFTVAGGNSCRLDYIRLNYLRNLTATATPYSFSIPENGPVKLQISDASVSTHLWRIGQNGVATEEVVGRLSGSTFEAEITTPQRRFVFFDESKSYDAPEFVGNVENQNLHSHRNVDYVIIVPASGKLVKQAERLGQLHADHDSLTYQVVRADQLYNEFSSGTPDASAYRRYLKMLYDYAGNDISAMPRYCLLLGKSPWDNRFLTEYWSQRSKSMDDYLLAYEADNTPEMISSVNSYVSDDFYGILDDGEGNNITRNKVDVALGRMVCTTADEAAVLIDKVEIYLSNKDLGKWKTNIAMLADDGDDNGHIRDSEAVAAAIQNVAPDLNIKKHYWDRYRWTASATGYSYPQATADIKKQMQDGAILFNYSGHGSPHLISHQKVLNTKDFSQALSPYMPLWVLASCEIYPYDHEDTNLAETSLFLRNGGSIAFVCATRAVYASYNNVFNRAYCAYVLSKDETGNYNTMGDALRMAKNEIVEKGGDLTINKLKYILFGDPALRLAIPSGRVVLDSINGQCLTDARDLINLPAGSVADFVGHICLDDGISCDPDFDGEVLATIFDAPLDVTCINNQKSDAGPYVFSERARIVYKGSTKADKGMFSFKVAIPRDISYSPEAGRISFYATTSDKHHEYKGISEAFCMNGTAEGIIDKTPPHVAAYINSTDNPDYCVTDSNPVLIATVSDFNGVSSSGLSLGHNIELVLDDNASEVINLNDYFNYYFNNYQSGRVVYPLYNLSIGHHKATVRAWDLYDNVATSDVHFIVSLQGAKMGKHGSVTSTVNPATTSTSLIAFHPTDDVTCERTTFEIFDRNGGLVTRIDADPDAELRGCSILNWNLYAHNGNPLNAGVYFYRAVFHTSAGKRISDAQKLIIIR